jgi:hypothetical protein
MDLVETLQLSSLRPDLIRDFVCEQYAFFEVIRKRVLKHGASKKRLVLIKQFLKAVYRHLSVTNDKYTVGTLVGMVCDTYSVISALDENIEEVVAFGQAGNK